MALWHLLLGADDLLRWGRQAPSVMWSTHATAEQVRALAQTRFDALLAHARQHSPFYAALYRNLPKRPPIEALPPVSRKSLMASFDDWVTDRAIRRRDVESFIADPARRGEPFLGRYAVWTSSGTTGLPGLYVNDQEALAVYEALLTLRMAGAGGAGFVWRSLAGGERMAMIAATGGHFAGIVSWERQRKLHPWLSLRARAFSVLEPIDRLVAQLNDWQPALLSSYPTMLAVLAAEREAGRLHLNPSALWSGGEELGWVESAHLQQVFGCPVHEEYGASECMNMAFSCDRGSLHLNSDWVILEPVDAQYRPVPPGEPSATTLLTNLCNRVQPIIRYEIGDSVTLLADPCGCGCTLPRIRVEGRRDDVMTLKTQRGRAVRIVPLAIESVIEDQAGVHDFQLLQTGTDTLAVRLVAPPGVPRQVAWHRVQAGLRHYLASQGVDAHLRLDAQKPQADPVSGKLHRVRVALTGPHHAASACPPAGRPVPGH